MMSNAMLNTQSNVRKVWIDTLKGIGIIFVVLGHIYSNRFAFDWLYSFHMPLFFVAAGFLYKKKRNIDVLKRKFQTVLVPYYTFGITVLLYWEFFERNFRSSDLTLAQSLFGLLSGNYRYLDFNVHLWFLPCFFITLVCFNYFQNSFGRKVTYSLTMALNLLTIYSLPEMPFGLNRMMLFIIFISIGEILSNIDFEAFLRKLKFRELSGACMCLFSINIGLVMLKQNTGIMWFITGGCGVMACITLAILLDTNARLSGFNKLLSRAGKISLSVLCVHGPVYRIVIMIVSVVVGYSIDICRENLAISVIVLVITMLICDVTYQVIEKYIPWALGKTISHKDKLYSYRAW